MTDPRHLAPGGLEVLRDMIPPAVRKAIYAVYLVAGIVLGVLAIVGDWAWLAKGQEVYAYLGIPVGIIAITNVVPNALVVAAPAEHVDPDEVV